jgi:hypothetical protein
MVVPFNLFVHNVVEPAITPDLVSNPVERTCGYCAYRAVSQFLKDC